MVDRDILIDFKKILFREGISADAFFHYVISKASIRDEDMLNLVNEAAKAYKNKADVFTNLSTTGKGSRSKQDIDAEMIYSMIESHLHQTQEQEEEEESEDDSNGSFEATTTDL